MPAQYEHRRRRRRRFASSSASIPSSNIVLLLVASLAISLPVQQVHAHFGAASTSASATTSPLLNSAPHHDDDHQHCFCELKGSINDCSCTVDTVDYFNNNRVFPRLRSLLLKDYFRFYRVKLHKGCPFWADDSKCAMRYCSVSACADHEVPQGLRADYHSCDGDQQAFAKYAPSAPAQTPADESRTCDASSSCAAPADHNVELSYLNTSISHQAAEGFERWADHDELAANFCILDDLDEGAEYVDLLLNPERYTGYRGESAHRVWRTIYEENCFGATAAVDAAGHRRRSVQQPFWTNDRVAAMCIEQRAFYRLLSGLHTSINVHLSAMYLRSEPAGAAGFMAPAGGTWGRNLDEFKRRFSAATTHGEGLHWLQNLYFIYLVEMRALAKAGAYLRQEKYFTGNAEEDAEVRQAVGDLLNVIDSFPTHFDESSMFASIDATGPQLKTMFREKFRNISQIMDCVGCDKCRLWGKLQVQGLGTALKILFSGMFEPAELLAQAGLSETDRRRHFRLRRTEIVSLFNAFGRLSNSINELHEFRSAIR